MQTACLNLKCPGLLIYRGDYYECVYCHTHYPVAQIHAMEPLPLSSLDEPPHIASDMDDLDEIHAWMVGDDAEDSTQPIATITDREDSR